MMTSQEYSCICEKKTTIILSCHCDHRCHGQSDEFDLTIFMYDVQVTIVHFDHIIMH